MRQPFVAALLTGIVGLSLIPAGQALDVNPPRVSDMSEATAFFANLAQTSQNPIISKMARESLRKIQNGAMTPAVDYTVAAERQKMVTEVALLPQVDNTYVVPAVVNHKYMATFLIDTGASYTVITPEMAESLGVAITEDTPSVPVTTANGTVEAPVVTLKRVSLGGMQVDNVEAVITSLGDAPQLSGLLGMSFFKGMELSFKQDRLRISR